MKSNKFWIKEAMGNHKKGALHRQLGVPASEKIPKTLLEKVVAAPIGTRVKNPTKTGDKRITVTRLVKQRAVPVLTINNLRKKK